MSMSFTGGERNVLFVLMSFLTRSKHLINFKAINPQTLLMEECIMKRGEGESCQPLLAERKHAASLMEKTHEHCLLWSHSEASPGLCGALGSRIDRMDF